MKRIALSGLAVVVVLAMTAPTAGAEGTGPKVTLRTAAGPLKKGAPLVAFSSGLRFTTSQSDVVCIKNTLSGIVKTNAKEKLAGEIAVANSSGESNGEGICGGSHVNGPAAVEWQNLPWKMKFTNTGTVQANTGVGDKTIKFGFTFPRSVGWQCTYSAKKWLSTFPISPTPVPFVITSDRAVFKLIAGSTAGCATEAKLSGEFEVTSNSEPVEVEVK